MFADDANVLRHQLNSGTRPRLPPKHLCKTASDLSTAFPQVLQVIFVILYYSKNKHLKDSNYNYVLKILSRKLRIQLQHRQIRLRNMLRKFLLQRLNCSPKTTRRIRNLLLKGLKCYLQSKKGLVTKMLLLERLKCFLKSKREKKIK